MGVNGGKWGKTRKWGGMGENGGSRQAIESFRFDTLPSISPFLPTITITDLQELTEGADNGEFAHLCLSNRAGQEIVSHEERIHIRCVIRHDDPGSRALVLAGIDYCDPPEPKTPEHKPQCQPHGHKKHKCGLGQRLPLARRWACRGQGIGHG